MNIYNTGSVRKTALGIATGLSLILSGTAQAALHDRGGGLIYDDVLNVTWLQDANYAQTSGFDADGGMTWNAAVAWAAGLNYYDSVHNVTYSDWRLPSISPIDGVTWNNIISYNGTTDAGFNISAAGTPYAGSTASELAFMFHQNLGNQSIYTPQVTLSSCGYALQIGGSCLENMGPFMNLKSGSYWTGEEYGYDSTQAWEFLTNAGMQGAAYKVHPNNNLYAWAVRVGDVAAVPEPEAYAMLLAGLGLVGWAARRRSRAEA
jgi:hypothetical protein